jgi:hypothetical protein
LLRLASKVDAIKATLANDEEKVSYYLILQEFKLFLYVWRYFVFWSFKVFLTDYGFIITMWRRLEQTLLKELLVTL